MLGGKLKKRSPWKAFLIQKKDLQDKSSANELVQIRNSDLWKTAHLLFAV